MVDRSLGAGSIAGDQVPAHMEQARELPDGRVRWVEPASARPRSTKSVPTGNYFELLCVKDAHARSQCRHENGTEPWACSTATARRAWSSGWRRKRARR